MMDVYREFPGEYRVDPQPDIALLHERHIYGPGESVPGTDIPIGFRVGDAPQWIGYFRAGGSGSPRALSAVFTLPHPTTALVVADGSGYMVDVHNPDNYLGVDLYQPVSKGL